MKHTQFLAGLAASAAVTLAAGSAQASTYQFTLGGPYSASWQLPSTLTPDAGETDVGFVMYNTAGFDDAVLGVADVYFWNSAFGGGLEIDDFYGGVVLVSTDGPQLYSGGEQDQITFNTGSFALTQYQGSHRYSLTITDLNAAAVPEPASIAMLLAGLGMVGATAARRRKGSSAAL